MPIPVKMTRAHQITLPKRLLKEVGWLDKEFFVADVQGQYLVLKPLTFDSRSPLASLADLRRHFAKLKVTPRDVRQAVAWARQHPAPEASKRRATS